MYSFAQRPDTKVVDEPLYAAYLSKNSNISRPYREELLQIQELDPNKVINELYQDLVSSDRNVMIAKHMARHSVGVEESLLQRTIQIGDIEIEIKHVFLIRDPMSMIISWNKKMEVHNEKCSLESTCFGHIVHLFSKLRSQESPTIVVDSDILMKYPEEVMIELCTRLNIPFHPLQLHWEAGPKPYDGLWAAYWYGDVHQSTGFGEGFVSEAALSTPKFETLSKDQMSVYRDSLPFFELMNRHAIGIDPLCPGTSFPANHLTMSPLSSLQRLADIRNADVLAWVGDRLLPRESAKVSVFDSAVQGGDAVWEGIRIYDGRAFMLDDHLDRLFDSAKAMAFENIPTRHFVTTAIFKTLAANGMRDSAHIRLTLTRGAKITSSMNPKFNIFGCNLIVLAEWKPVGDVATYDNNSGIKLITATNRRNSPQCVDSKIHHCNLINNILPKIQANVSDAADALMLDTEGFVSETNATNVFMVKRGVLHTPHADYCLPGVTRRTVISIAENLSIKVQERRISLAEFHSADEVFTTGTMGELTPVKEIDGRRIGPGLESGAAGPVTRSIQAEYRRLTEHMGVQLPF